MSDKSFVWTTESAERFFELKLQHDWLFKKKKQPWKDFRLILLRNGYPEVMTLDHMRKKWTYTYDSYKEAKKLNNKRWPYYKIFEQYLGGNTVLDKYESWSDEWRLKLITACKNAHREKKAHEMTAECWKSIEQELRLQNLPSDCCIQDISGLWHHLKVTFHRKYRLSVKKGAELSEWAPYEAMLDYYRCCEPGMLPKLEGERRLPILRKSKKFDVCKQSPDCDEFQWTRDMTESFIQIRLQHEWLFKEKKWAWREMHSIMLENGYPESLSFGAIRKKWSSIFSEYQKSKATNNTNWIYYSLFELYLNEDSLNIDPLRNWKDEWVLKLISARSENEALFQELERPFAAWRQVEKNLRQAELPVDHSLFRLPEIWAHLEKTFRWKQKFASKGLLNEDWPYYRAMEQYFDNKHINQVQAAADETSLVIEYEADGFDEADDVKLFDLKHRLEEKPKFECSDEKLCRACCRDDASVDIFEDKDEEEYNLAHKLRVIGGVDIETTDKLSRLICSDCVKALENAYTFRIMCQNSDKQYRLQSQNNIKIECLINVESNDDFAEDQFLEDTKLEPVERRKDIAINRKAKIKTVEKLPKPYAKMKAKTKNKERKKYIYRRICEVCGKPVQNMKEHMNGHTIEKLYECEICKSKFRYKSGLLLHRVKHNDTPAKTCEICGKSFNHISQYRRHYVHHANERKFTCETCGKSFNTKDILIVHNRSHTDERPFSCSDCSKSFRTAGCVWRHKRIVHKEVVKSYVMVFFLYIRPLFH